MVRHSRTGDRQKLDEINLVGEKFRKERATCSSSVDTDSQPTTPRHKPGNFVASVQQPRTQRFNAAADSASPMDFKEEIFGLSTLNVPAQRDPSSIKQYIDAGYSGNSSWRRFANQRKVRTISENFNVSMD